MKQYTFRGQPISGAGAWVLFQSVKRVMAECPDPTLEDVLALSEIIKDFEERLVEGLKEEREQYLDEDGR
jgi:hypothetical protein